VIEGTRIATEADVPVLAALTAAAVAEQRDGRGGAVWAVREAREVPADESLRASVADPAQIVLAGTIDEVVVGYAVARLEELRDGTRLGVITDIYTDPGAREVGIGEALVDEVLKWANDEGCRGVDALVLPGNRETKNFFETAGLTARAIVVHKRLDG
jgi:ribosomal protein S18 acetylase RimI-like enzyme